MEVSLYLRTAGLRPVVRKSMKVYRRHQPRLGFSGGASMMGTGGGGGGSGCGAAATTGGSGGISGGGAASTFTGAAMGGAVS